MAIATELTINTAATAMQMAQTIFGSGVQVQSATFSNTAASLTSGIYTGAQTTIPGIVPGDTGVILSTGRVTDFTNSSGTTDTNIAVGTTFNSAGIDGDAQLNAVAGRGTFDGAILNATFIPDGDFLTMQFVFTSEEYPEYVGSNFNDAFGVWVNGNFVPMTITTTGEVAINTVNGTSNQNLYHDNTTDQYNTEMDGFTRILSFKAPVNSGQINTIKIGIADAGDTSYDSNLLISGESIQTIALAFDDDIQLLQNSSRTFDILSNDNDQTDGGLTITHINDIAVVAGQTVVLATGESVRLNADGTVTVFSDADVASTNLNYRILDSAGNTDTGFITINTIAATARDGIIEGTSGADVIEVGYLGDPDGDRVENNDALGVGGTTGDGDYVISGAGDDSITVGNGNDVVYAGADNDTVFGGAGNDWVDLGIGNDSFGTYGTDSAGNDSVYGDAGNDTIIGGAGLDRLYGGAGNDSLSGGMGSDSLYGGDGEDLFVVTDDHESDVIDGGSGGTDTDTIALANSLTTQGVNVTFTGAEAGSYAFAGTPSGFAQGAGTFTEIEGLSLTEYADTVNGAANTAAMTVSGNGGADVLSGGSAADTLFGGIGNDTLTGNEGADSLSGAEGDDSLTGGQDNDTLSGGTGSDTLQGGAGADSLIGSIGMDFADYSTSGAGVAVDLFAGTASGGDAAGDTVQGSVDGIIGSGFDDTLTGNDGESTLAGDVFTTVIYGGGGNDLIDGRAGADSLYGGTGADTITSGTGADYVLAGDDADLINAGSGDTVDGGEGPAGTDDDTLVATGVRSVAFDGLNPENGTITFIDNSTLTFTNIENLLLNGTPDGIVTGTAAGEVMNVGYVDADGDIIDAGDAILPGDAPDDDRIYGLDGDDTITGGAGADQIYGGGDRDEMSGAAGNDSLSGDVGDDTMSGGADNDTLWGGADNDSLSGDAGDDLVEGESGNDQLFGGTGADVLSGGDGADLIYGGTDADSDQLQGGADRDTIFAGAGDVVDGGSAGDDYDILDLSAYRHSGTTIRYDINDPTGQSGEVDFLDAGGLVTGTLQFSEIEKVIACFTPGTLILTDRGEVPVEKLCVGDRVLSRDNGYQPIAWLARRDLTEAELRANAAFNPVRIAKGALGEGLPVRDLIVSPQHRMLIFGPKVELLFGEHEVLVAAIHMVGMPGVTRLRPAGVSYIHFMCDAHEIVRADGAWSESFQPGAQTIAGLGAEQRAELLALFPDVLGCGAFDAARLSLRAREATVLLSADRRRAA